MRAFSLFTFSINLINQTMYSHDDIQNNYGNSVGHPVMIKRCHQTTRLITCFLMIVIIVILPQQYGSRAGKQLSLGLLFIRAIHSKQCTIAP